jgi:hypothetical protein
MLPIAYWMLSVCLLAAVYWLLYIAYWLLAVVYWLLSAVYWLFVRAAVLAVALPEPVLASGIAWPWPVPHSP